MSDGASHSEPSESGPTGRAEHLLRVRRPREAAEVAYAEVARSPDDERCRRVLISALIDLGEFADALVIAEAGCRLQPDSAVMHAGRAAALRADLRPGPAAEAAETALRRDPTNVDLVLEHAQCMLALSRWMAGPAREKRRTLLAAAGSADRALEMAPNYSATHFIRADVHSEAKEWQEMRASAQAGLRLAPDSVAGHQLAGIAQKKMKDRRAAGDHFVSAGRADPRSDTSGELLDMTTSAPFKWAAVWVCLGAPTASFFDGSFAPWMWAPLVLGAVGGVWLKWAPTNRMSEEAETVRRRARRLETNPARFRWRR